MRLSKQTTDATKILVMCAQSDGARLKVARVSEALSIPKPLTLKLVNALARLGYLETTRGPRGGIVLAVDPASVTLGRIVGDLEAFAGPDDGEQGADASGDFGTFVGDAFQAFLDVLDRHSLADMARSAQALPMGDTRDAAIDAGPGPAVTDAGATATTPAQPRLPRTVAATGASATGGRAQ